MKLSILISARNEAEHLPTTIAGLVSILVAHHVPHEIIVVDDHSTDRTVACVKELQALYPTVRLVPNDAPPGF